MPLLPDVAIGARFFAGLPGFLRHPISPEEARAILRRRLEHREADFLALVRRAIFANPASPYRALFGLAGCEVGDLERLIQREGIEGALLALYTAGVYLTTAEFKGRQPAVRGSARLRVDPAGLRNPRANVSVVSQSSGSRGPRMAVPIDFPTIRDRALNTCLVLEARGGAKWYKAVWAVPGGSLITLLRYAGFGSRPVKWFSQVDPAAPSLHPRYRWSAHLARLGSLVAGVPLPGPTYVPPDRPLPIAHWMAAALRSGATPHLHTFASSAVRLCRAACEAGLDLSGAQFTLVGEPTTEARLAVIRRAGAEAVPDYGSAESGGFIAYGCLAPRVADDLHHCQDLHALVQPPSPGPPGGLPARALLVSSIRPTAPLVLLNVSPGDQAIVSRRCCGCPLEQLGWTTHLQEIRSFEKLTAGGMTFLDTDVIGVLEETLPARFGGGPTDYQLVEEEAESGEPRVRLLADPRLGPLDEVALAEAFLAAIGSGRGVERIMAIQWRDSGILGVERRPPLAAPSGKILHLHRASWAAARVRTV